MRRPPREALAEGKDSRAVKRQVRQAALMADGAMALGAHIMEGVKSLDEHRRRAAGGAEHLNAIMAEIEITALEQAQSIQRKLYNPWGL